MPELLEDDLDDVPELGVELTLGKQKYVDSVFEHGLHQEGVQAYLATTAYVDAQMGRYTHYVDGQEEFYDTTKDPCEWTNRIGAPEYAPVIERMRAAIPSPSDAATPLPAILSETRE